MSRPDQPFEPEPTRYDENSVQYPTYGKSTRKIKTGSAQYGLTDPQVRAIKWMYTQGYQDNGATGVLDKYGRVVINGQSRKSTEPVTWLRLVLKDLVCGTEGRIGLTAKGIEWCEKWLPRLYGESQFLEGVDYETE